MRHLGLLLIVLSGVPQWSWAAQPQAGQTGFEHHGSKVKAVALVIHGLNQRPEGMNPIIEQLQRAQINVLRLELKGHRQSAASSASQMQDFKTVVAADWLSETKAAYAAARQRATAFSVPLYFVGYSLGGLLGETIMAQDAAVIFDRVLLFAPALEFRNATFWVRLLSKVAKVVTIGESMVLKSANLPEYRANQGTPLAAYRAFFELHEAFKNSFSVERANVPTLVLCDPADELVDCRELAKWKEKKALSQWSVELITDRSSLPPQVYHHMITDSKLLGAQAWISLSERFMNFLKERLSAR